MQNNNTITLQKYIELSITEPLVYDPPDKNITQSFSFTDTSGHLKTSRSSPRNNCVFLPIDVPHSQTNLTALRRSVNFFFLFFYSTWMNYYTIFRLILFFVLRSALQVHPRKSLRFGFETQRSRRNEPTQKKASDRAPSFHSQENATKQMQFSHSDHTRNRTKLHANRSHALNAHFHNIFDRFWRIGNQFRDDLDLLRNFALSWLDGWLSYFAHQRIATRLYAKRHTQNIGNREPRLRVSVYSEPFAVQLVLLSTNGVRSRWVH